MSETYQFVETAPVKRPGRQGAGRKREDNPFEDAVREIAGQTDEHGNPRARSTTFVLDAENGETEKQRTARIRRFLTRAGKDIVADGADALKINMVVKAGRLDGAGNVVDAPEGTYVVTFWHRQD